MNKKKILGILLMMPMTILMLYAIYIAWEYVWIFVIAAIIMISTIKGIEYLAPS